MQDGGHPPARDAAFFALGDAGFVAAARVDLVRGGIDERLAVPERVAHALRVEVRDVVGVGRQRGEGVGRRLRDLVVLLRARGAADADRADDVAAAYKVNASRRDGPGEAEVHLGETDIFYVLDGSATFITGGTLVDGRSTGAGELRGSGIEGGTERTLRKGDVVVIPSGVPHWFKRVDAPVAYYVVKSIG
jgi:mannose-6-phosphate isomerase-like protein (cupin superfamily)